MHAIYHDRIAKRIGTILRYAKETVYKDIHIHVLIKTVEGQDVRRYSKQRLDYNWPSVCQTRKYAYNSMLSYLIHAKDYQKHQYAASDVLTIVGRLQDIYKANKINWQRLVKTEEQKNTQANGCPNIDALLTKSWITNQSLYWLCRTKNGIYHK